MMREIITGTEKNIVDAFPYSIFDLLTKDFLQHPRSGEVFRLPIKLDRYQRPYVWSNRKVVQLLDDLNEHEHGAYYLGSVLLHQDNQREEEGLYIIDGQQRLTTLLLLFREVFEASIISPKVNLSYFHQRSFENIRNAYNLIHDYIKRSLEETEWQERLQQLEITIIKTTDIDLAFTFFDSQNSRGVVLKSTDLLKSYHLREINQLKPKNESDREYLERKSARRWEQMQTFKGVLSDKHDFAYELFHKVLWRARSWKGNKVEKEERELVIKEFQDRTVRDDSTGTIEIPLYPNRQNMLSRSLVESKEGGLKRSGDQIDLSGRSSNLPFTLRQPIHRGQHYFLFARKYAEIVNELYNRESGSDLIKEFQEYVEKVVENNSYYLEELFLVCSVAYYDKYGVEKFLTFVQLLGLAHAKKRFELSYFFQKSAFKYISEYNLLDIISHSFRPDQVINSLRSHILDTPYEGVNTTSKVNIIDKEETENKNQFELSDIDGNGVNEKCLQAFMEYYNDIKWDRLRSEDGNELNITAFANKIINRVENAK